MTVADASAPMRLDAFLASQLPWRSRRSVAELVLEGAVSVNGRRAKKSHRVGPGDRIDLTVPRSEDDDPEALAAIELDVLFEDADLVVVNKPPDLAVHAASTCQYRNLLRRLELRYAREQPDPEATPSLVHRLDRTTSGVIAVARRRELVAFYTAQFERRTVRKEYAALVRGRPPEHGHIELPLRIVDRRPVEVHPSGLASHTEFRTVASTDEVSVVEIVLHTGRKHQIRAHMAAIGHPLVDDGFYGEPAAPQLDPERPGPLLHAAVLELDHRDGRRLRFEAPLPARLHALLHDASDIVGR